jgi:apolipoprotein N-acyltransferase
LKTAKLLGLSALTGILLTMAWPMAAFTMLIFIALVPLLYLADYVTKPKQFFGFAFISFFIWNASTTWWLWNSTGVGAVAAITANTLLMCLPWWGFFACKKKYSGNVALLMLLLFWMSFEYIHLNWELSWPWLTLGNVFATNTHWIQWYEYTGVGGGSLLILVMNIFTYQLLAFINQKVEPKKMILKSASILLLIILFFATNRLIKVEDAASATKENVVIIQPNISPYEKFELSAASKQIQLLISLSESAIDSNTKLIIWPETAMSVADWQDNIASNSYYQPIFEFAKQHPTITILSGIETFKSYGNNKATPTARTTDNDIFYDAFNASIAIKANEVFQLYNKSKLVPGVESLPSFLRFLAPAFEKFGGTTGGYGTSDSAAVFSFAGNPYTAAPIICYESIYGEYVGSYVKKGASLLAVITNDGWWGNTPGHLQHLSLARLRAIETRRWVARSANTGISAVINHQGEILAQQPWDKVAFIKYAIPNNTELTFYVQYGDYIYKGSLLLCLILIATHLFNAVKKKFTKV